MNIKSICAAALLAGLAVAPASAQLKPFTDFEISDEVWVVTAVKVDPNMGDYYLEGLRETWVKSNEMAKELGHIEDYTIFGSAFSESGEFNMMLAVKFSSMADMAPSKAQYDEFMAAWGEANQERNDEIARDYPSMRKIVGEYVFHELTMLGLDGETETASN